MTEIYEDGYRETIVTIVSDGTRIWQETRIVDHPKIGRIEHSIPLTSYISKHVELSDHEKVVVDRLVDEEVSDEFIRGILGKKAMDVCVARSQWRRNDMEPTSVLHIKHEDVVRYEKEMRYGGV